ncbi:MAG: F0F1 ATP synthase subunit B [Puniceicoccales bacterium]|jgi:F-type H+-transporting ATPase subunit b|nr:F0F1 ATP synthase subunit B [Puniceicoccales bacterium]
MFEIGTVVLGNVEAASPDLLGTFGVHWSLLLIQALNFFSVVAILYFFAFKPVLKTMEERRAKIEGGLQYAEDMRVQLERCDGVIQERLAHAKEEAHQIIEEAKQQSKIYADRQREEVEQLGEEMIRAAKESIREEKAKMLIDLRSEVKILVGDIAEKVLAKELSTEERRRYLDGVEFHW